jgi:DNA modification methylase
LSKFWDEDELQELLNQSNGDDLDEAPEPKLDQAAELEKKWSTELGQIWEIGKHRLMCGDSTDAASVGKLMGEARIRLTWTDPPYGVNYGGAVGAGMPYRVRQIKNDNLSAEELENLIRSALKNAAEHSLPGAAVYTACPAGDMLPSLIAAFTGSGFDFRWQLVWLKDQIVLSRADYHFKHENILYGWKPDGPHYFTSDRTQASVFECPRPKVSEEHPTMKPPQLIRAMLQNSSKAGEVVYDAFMGSGSTMVAAHGIGRICYSIEIEPKYAAVTLERMKDMGLKPKRAD